MIVTGDQEDSLVWKKTNKKNPNEIIHFGNEVVVHVMGYIFHKY